MKIYNLWFSKGFIMEQNIYNIKNISVLFLQADCRIKQSKKVIDVCNLLSQTSKPILILCIGKYSVKLGINIFDKIADKIEKMKPERIKYISYCSLNPGMIYCDINNFITNMTMKN